MTRFSALIRPAPLYPAALAMLLWAFVAGCGAPPQPAEPAPLEPLATERAKTLDGYRERWCYVSAKLGSDKDCDAAVAALKLSDEADCTHVLLIDGRAMRWADDPDYLARVAKVKAAAQELHLTLVTSVVGIGYSGKYFHYDANLAAGVPVKNMVFVVKDGKALPDAAQSLDLTALPKSGPEIAGTVAMQPFMHYKITFHLAGGAGDPPTGDETVTGFSSGGKRRNCVTNPVYEKDGDGFRGLTTFNSLEGDKLKLHIDGQGWTVSDLKIEPAGLLLILRRDLLPLTVTSDDGKTTYEEGRDFEKIIDPCLQVNPFPGDVTNNHAPAEFVLTPASRIHEGDKLKLTFWHTIRIYSDQDSISLEDPRTWTIYENEIKNTVKVWGLGGYFINYDEIRMGGWEPQPNGATLTPGQLLARHFKRNYDFLRTLAPTAKIYTWSDMFTPYHNAYPYEPRGYYYLVHGNWDGSWAGLPKDVIIFNWYAPKAEGVKFFADRGQQQIFCGYYDASKAAKMQENIDTWLNVGAGQPGVLGFMYTTWHGEYKALKPYFGLLDAARAKGTAPAHATAGAMNER